MASSVDRSILHLAYVKKHLPASLVGDVLLFKRFLKSQGLYGAEIRVEGFSGYLCELLVIAYGGFLQLLRAISKWEAPVFLDLEKHHPGGKSAALVDFKNIPLVVIDPVDPNRNVAAIVSEENLRRLVSLAKRFVRSPSAKFFAGSEEDFQNKRRDALFKAKGAIYSISFKRPKLVDDILWGQLKRFARVVQVSLEKMDFQVLEWQTFADKKQCVIFYRLKEGALGPTKSILGPPLKLAPEHAVKFRKSHALARFSVKKGRLIAEVKREIRTSESAFKSILKERHGFPSHIPEGLPIKRIK